MTIRRSIESGRLAISDVVAIAPIPEHLRTAAASIAGCIGGAALLDDVKSMLVNAGFKSVEVKIAPNSAEIVDSWLAGASKYIASATIEAREGQRRRLHAASPAAARERVTCSLAGCRGAAAPVHRSPSLSGRAEIDDVMQDVFIRMQRGLSQLRDEERFTSWLFQIARSSVAEHMRTRARHPIADDEAEQPPAQLRD